MQAILFGLVGKSAIFLFQVIADELVGTSCFPGGLASAVLGAFCHFLIAFTAAAVFWTASRKPKFAVRHSNCIRPGLWNHGLRLSDLRCLASLAYQIKIALPPSTSLRSGLFFFGE
ncbi:MAG: hypothetical protein WA254_00545 [Candidatus Sulfotelmatobacter sp.]